MAAARRPEPANAIYLTGYPHEFQNFGGHVKLSKRCTKLPKGVKLLEYPIYKDEGKQRSWEKDGSKKEQDATPLRVLSTTDHNFFCGVMTHDKENGQHSGEGGFHICTYEKA